MEDVRSRNRNRFEDLEVWSKSHKLTLEIYKITNKFPNEEKFRLGDQLRRSTASIATNIVEGNSRKYRKEFLQFLNMARSSLEETKYHLLLARDLGYLSLKSYTELHLNCEEIGKMLASLTRYLKS
ncbi:MAG: hypothetical protein A2Z11_04385 [Candidatus Woykebacteria bacterium RBG_16_43_9]|uniref:Four helix bundle protein n=1 Tax=Candidatus Woykebacteria bacterium RBG_16_43_9 TaxID=1802596 RepID=A0A1G1WF77_9BACT|nr:MAG: hypothetical protein A2Z11_04385 [Candidatus Woykebacteria bacterium RBG_16_43_9]